MEWGLCRGIWFWRGYISGIEEGLSLTLMWGLGVIRPLIRHHIDRQYSFVEIIALESWTNLRHESAHVEMNQVGLCSKHFSSNHDGIKIWDSFSNLLHCIGPGRGLGWYSLPTLPLFCVPEITFLSSLDQTKKRERERETERTYYLFHNLV